MNPRAFPWNKIIERSACEMPVTCPACHGLGRPMRLSKRPAYGGPCRVCGGKGNVLTQSEEDLEERIKEIERRASTKPVVALANEPEVITFVEALTKLPTVKNSFTSNNDDESIQTTKFHIQCLRSIRSREPLPTVCVAGTRTSLHLQTTSF
jgi:hypothetical protein